MRILIFTLSFIVSAAAVYPMGKRSADDPAVNRSKLVFLPGGLGFSPLKGNIHEARIGLFKFLDASGMRVDIGNSVGLIQINPGDRNTEIRAGICFWAHAYVKNYEGLRLQIDAIDGFFGGDISAVRYFEKSEVQARLRFLHHSAHFADGHYNEGRWIDNREPIPFTRDYGELTAALMLTESFISFRYYGGFSYATFVRPAEIKRFQLTAGIELSSSSLIDRFLQRPVNLFLVHNITLTGIPEYIASHQIQAGIKFGEMDGRGINLFIAYYTGMHMFAEYYDTRLRTIGAGFSVDYF